MHRTWLAGESDGVGDVGTLVSADKPAKRVRVPEAPARAKDRWTPDEDERLRAMWGVEPLHGIARTFQRTQRAVYLRAVRILGLTGKCPEGWELITEAARRTGYAVSTLRGILREAGIKPIPSYSGRSADPHSDRHRSMIIETADVDFAVAARGETETLFGAAERRGMSTDKLLRILAAAGITRPERKLSQRRVPADKLRRALRRKGYDALMRRLRAGKGVLKIPKKKPSEFRPADIVQAGVPIEQIASRLSALGHYIYQKDVWRIRTDDIEAAIKAFEERQSRRETVAEAGRRYGVHEQTMSKILKAHGVTVRRHLGVDPADVDRVMTIERARKTHGEMITEAARRLGVDSNTLQRWLVREGIETFRKMRLPPETYDRVVSKARYRPEGETVQQAARRLKMRPETLSRWLKEHGVVIQGTPIPTAEINRIAALMRPNMETIPAIAKRLKTQAGTLRKWLMAEGGVEIRRGYAYRGESLVGADEIEECVRRNRKKHKK